MINKITSLVNNYSPDSFTKNSVITALKKDCLSILDFQALLSCVAEDCLEEMALRAKKETKKYYGNSISLYTPLYISNFCENHCIYCGFNSNNIINRGKLSFDEIDDEMASISKSGLSEILLLTGEDRTHSNIEYIGEAIKIAKKYFTTIGIEIYPLEIEEYRYVKNCGADFVSVYQETYNQDLYDKLHIKGPKRDFDYRFNSQERACLAGMYGVSFGVLLGLSDFRRDAFATGCHAYFIQRKYPNVEIAFSVPRLRSFINSLDKNKYNSIYNNAVSEKNLLQVMLAYRIFMPFATISISTREREGFRDNIIGLAANKISAEVKTSVGGHVAKKGDEQFEICDKRNVKNIHKKIIEKGLQPVYSNHLNLSVPTASRR